MDSLLEKVKANLIITHNEDDALITHLMAAVVSYAETFQNVTEDSYSEGKIPPLQSKP